MKGDVLPNRSTGAWLDNTSFIMIKKINNFTYKSFTNYTGPDDEFREVNVLFGYNGKGKTALVEGIKKEFSKPTRLVS